MEINEKASPILILGIGNNILMDDGIGPLIVTRLSNEFHNSCCTFQTINTGGLEILEFIAEFSQVIIIDAIKTKDGIPGDIYYLSPSCFRETCHISSFHDVSFLNAIKLGRLLGYNIPEIGIVAIEVVEDMCFGTSFSTPILSRYEEIYSEIRELLLPALRGGGELVFLDQFTEN